MSWKPFFKEGTSLFKQGEHSEALEQFTQALANGGKKQFIIYDSRAAVYEQLDNPKDALSDAKSTIQVAPRRWQGYARAARLFMKTHKFDSSIKMVDLALTHLAKHAHTRREILLQLKQEIVETREAVAEQERRMQNHMLRVPIEIYGEIFQLLLAGNHAQIITLLHVCKHWRQIVWDTPGLWHTLVLSKFRPDQKASLWIERSRHRIRELHVLPEFSWLHFPKKTKLLEKMKWNHLRTLRINNDDFLIQVDPDLMFRELEHLEITTDDCSVKETFLHPATKLTSLSVEGILMSLKHLTPHLQHLSSLNLTSCSFQRQLPRDFIPLLALHPQLESLRLDRVSPMATAPWVVPPDLTNPVILRNLKSLEVIQSWWASFILILDIPALRILQLDNISRHIDTINDNFSRWLSTSPQFLTEIRLKQTPINEANLIQLVRTVHSIEVLALTGIYDTVDKVVNMLIEGSVPDGARIACLCPKLRHLDVSNCPDIKTSTVHALVKQRLALSEEDAEDEAMKVNKLEVLKMDGCIQVDVKWIPWFCQRVPTVSCVYSTQKQKRSTAKRLNGL